jgi:DNA-binding beta-propeller fold protein YncE
MKTRCAAVMWVPIAIAAGCGSAHHPVVAAASSPAVHPTVLRCGAPAVSGRALMPASRVVRLPGAPDGVATTPDGRALFVAIQTGTPRIAVIDNRLSGLRLRRTVPVPGYPSGMKVTPNGRYVLGAIGRGAVVLDVAAAISGVGRSVLGSLAVPAGVAGAGAGAAEITVSPDSRYAFVTLEGAGRVAVFDLAGIGHEPGAAGFRGTISVGAGALGITGSPDGRWLYEVSESARAGSAHGLGALNVIDQRLAVSDPARAVVSTAPVGCAPVRVAVSADGTVVWVTARDANALLGFSAAALRGNPTRALVSVTRVGHQPLGLAVAGDRTVLVADSDLSDSPRARSGVSVIDTASSPQPALRGFIGAGKLADAVVVARHGAIAVVTSSDSRQLRALSLDQLP